VRGIAISALRRSADIIGSTGNSDPKLPHRALFHGAAPFALVERLFSLTRAKLMKIPAFAWAYGKFRQAKAWLEATEAWRTIRSVSQTVRHYVTQIKTSRAVPFRQSRSV
jgi:hypothetical protein